jgi:probable DNA repair protein
VLGLLEAAGLQFAGAWLCDMGDDRWPSPAAPNPLLPRDLQRRLRMPRCDAQREYDIAAKLSASLLASAERVVVSYQREREEVARAPSPLFQALPRAELTEIISGETLSPSPRRRWLSETAALERIAAGAAPPLAAAERPRGGSALLANQAACPFRAFASQRLGATPLAEPQRGLSAADRGNLLHQALERLWRQLEHRAGLLALDPAARRERAHSAAAAAVDELWQQLARPLGRRLAELECERLAALLERWLALEAERAEFVVVAVEQRRDFRLAGLALTLRVDRIERLPDGRLLVIDYKTGACAPGDWLGERPQQPQLPLYSVLLEDDAEQVAGVLFAQVRAGQGGPRLRGAGDVGLSEHGIAPAADLRGAAPPGWPQLKQQWRQALQQLADEFIEGRAVVEPHSAASCQYCALPALCRIDHQRQMDAAAEAVP